MLSVTKLTSGDLWCVTGTGRFGDWTVRYSTGTEYTGEEKLLEL